MSRAGIDYIGNQPIYTIRPTYIHYNLPFRPYRVWMVAGWSGEINVSAALMDIYTSKLYSAHREIDGERLAVAITVWGDLKERFGDKLEAYCVKYGGRDAVRDRLIAEIQYEPIFTDAPRASGNRPHLDPGFGVGA